MHHLTTRLGRELFVFKPWHGELPREQEQEVLLYRLALEGDYQAFWPILNAEEQARATRFIFDKHRRRFVHARATLRILLGQMLGIPPAYIAFTYNKQGKPALTPSTRPLEFNLSHSGETALFAFGYHKSLGVDIEYFSSRDYLGIAKNLFSASEYETLAKAPLYLKPLVFFSLWSQKEAFIKTSGLGLSYPTKAFSCDWRPLQQTVVNDSLFGQQYRMHSFLPEPACAAALCCHLDTQHIAAFTLDPKSLLRQYHAQNH